MTENIKFAVIGGGSWAAIQKCCVWIFLKFHGTCVTNESAIEHINAYKHNPNYLSSVEFDTKKLKLTSDINEAVAYADYIIFAVPSAFLSDELEN
jgi:glycerol-3-phosphate dehydrogenase (NAD(P)+)